MTKRTFLRSLAAFTILPSLPMPKPAPKMWENVRGFPEPKEVVFDPKAYYGEWKFVCGESVKMELTSAKPTTL